MVFLDYLSAIYICDHAATRSHCVNFFGKGRSDMVFFLISDIIKQSVLHTNFKIIIVYFTDAKSAILV